MGKRGVKPKGTVFLKWSPALAYAVGLLATDGSLSKDRLHIDFTSKDRGQVVTFQKCLGVSHIKIGRKGSGTAEGKKYFRIQFGDVLFYQWLLGIGLTPNKSKTLGPLKVPDQYFFDFLRGCFDGDGTIYSFWDKRWHSSYMFYIGFTSASKPFLEWLQSNTARLCGTEGKITQHVRSHQLRYAKMGSRVLFKKMFYADDIPYLKRKFTKAQKIFTIDRQHSQC